MALRRTHFVTVVASKYETFSYSVLEAMATGCPIVATAVGGIPELIKHDHNGLLIPSGNVPALVSACSRLLNERNLARRLARQAWNDSKTLYDPALVAGQTVKAYQQAISSFARR